MKVNELKITLKKVPLAPGVYFFIDNKGKNLYIGKASNLRKRLLSYTKIQDLRIKEMIRSATMLKYTETDSEIEALILESTEIKKYRPPFNIVMRDDKQYFYVGFTRNLDNEWPRIFLTHQPGTVIQPEADYIGPFTDGTPLKNTLRLLRKIFPYCTCKQKHNNFCLNYHIGKCLGVCCLKKPELRITNNELRGQKKRYTNNVRIIKSILNGKRTLLIKTLEKEMKEMANEGELEKAIELRKKSEYLKTVFENARTIKNTPKTSILKEVQSALGLNMLPTRIEAYDIANIQGKFAVGVMVVFNNGIPDKNEYRKFRIRTKATPDDTAMLKEILNRRFNHPEWQKPDLIIIDGGKGQLNAAINELRIINNELRVPIIALVKNERHLGEKILIAGKKKAIYLSKLSPTVKNLVLQADNEAHRFAINYYRTLHRRKIIN